MARGREGPVAAVRRGRREPGQEENWGGLRRSPVPVQSCMPGLELSLRGRAGEGAARRELC